MRLKTRVGHQGIHLEKQEKIRFWTSYLVLNNGLWNVKKSATSCTNFWMEHLVGLKNTTKEIDFWYWCSHLILHIISFTITYTNLDTFSIAHCVQSFPPSCFTFVFPRLDKVGLSTTYRETKMAVLIFMRKAKKK